MKLRSEDWTGWMKKGSEHLLTLLARTDLVTPSVVRLPLNGAALGLVEFHPGNSNLAVNVGDVYRGFESFEDNAAQE